MLAHARFQVYGMLSILGLSTPLIHSSDHLHAERWSAVGPSLNPEGRAAYAQVPGGDDDDSLRSFNTVRGGGFAQAAAIPEHQPAEPLILVVTFRSQDAYGPLLKGGIGGSSISEGSIHKLLSTFAKTHQGKMRNVKNEIFYTPTAWDEREKIKSTGRIFEITLPAGTSRDLIQQLSQELLDKKAILAIRAQDENGNKGLAIGVQEPILISTLSKPESKLRTIIDATTARYKEATGTRTTAAIVNHPIQKHKTAGGISYLVLFDEQVSGQRDNMVSMFNNLLKPHITITTQRLETVPAESARKIPVALDDTVDEEDDGAGAGH